MNKDVLVLGAGIAGIQASLDLADAGFRVYLVEREPSIGGNMPKVLKTFPTDDCAMLYHCPEDERGGGPQEYRASDLFRAKEMFR